MPETFALVRLLNALFMGIEVRAFQWVGLSPDAAAHNAVGVNQALSLELLVVAGLIAFFLLVRLTLSVEKPNPAQQIAEMIHEVIGNQAEQVIGHGYERFQAYVTCIFLFVLINNLLGSDSRLHGSHQPDYGHAGPCDSHLPLLQLPRHSRAGRRRLSEALCRADLVDGLADLSH